MKDVFFSNNNSPKLRFKEFNDEWEKVNLKNIFQYFSTNSLSRKQLSDTGIIKNIHYGDIHKKFTTIVDGDKTLDTYIKDLNYKNKCELCRNYDLIVADASEDYDGIGKAIEIINVNCEIVSGLHTILARDNSNIFAPKFKGYYFNSPVIHNQIKILANGFKVYGISKDTINKLDVKIPSKNEQQKIANILELLDKKIELQTNKIEEYKVLKKCCLKKVFKDTNTKLENTVISQIGRIEKGTQINSDELLANGLYYMLNGGMTPSGYVNEYNREEKTITISEGGNSCGFVNFNKQKFWCGGHCYSIKPINIDNDYLYQLLKFNENNLMKLRVGSGLPNIQKKDLETFKIKIHSQETQVKIANYFSKYDELIELEKEKLNKLQDLKKGLMQQMFI